MDRFIIGDYIDINDDIRLSWLRSQLENAIYNKEETPVIFVDIGFDISKDDKFVYIVDENLGD